MQRDSLFADGRIEVNTGQNCNQGTGWPDLYEHICRGKNRKGLFGGRVSGTIWS